jgi:hypothetical protein
MAMLGVNGGLIGKRRVPTVGGASGLWLLNEQNLAIRGNIWPVLADYTWTSPNTSNPPANAYRLYSTGYTRLSTTTSAGYQKDALLADLTAGRPVLITVNSINYSATITISAVLSDAGTSTERVDVTFSASPAFANTTLGDSQMVLALL